MNRILILIFVTALFTPSLYSEDEEAEVYSKPTGLIKTMANGTIIQFEMDGINIHVGIYDADYKPLSGVFTHGNVIVHPRGKGKATMHLRKEEDGSSFRSVKPIRRPHIFKAVLRLFTHESDEEADYFTFIYNEHTIKESDADLAAEQEAEKMLLLTE